MFTIEVVFAIIVTNRRVGPDGTKTNFTPISGVALVYQISIFTILFLLYQIILGIIDIGLQKAITLISFEFYSLFVNTIFVYILFGELCISGLNCSKGKI